MQIAGKRTSEKTEMLAQWLNWVRLGNSAEALGAYGEVVGLIGKLAGLETVLRQFPVAEVPVDGPSHFLFDSPGALLRDSINEQLARSPVIRSLRFSGAQEAELGWLSATPENEERKTLAKSTMIQILCDLADEGLLSSLKQCSLLDCGRWYSAVRSNMTYCKVKCRRKHHAMSEDYRTKRRIKMRDYYRLHKTKNVK